ncbi:jacalin-related lectin 34-like [Ananas comosus]|uniref:Jacalin-related lectin 34-like n=1 Tax=Ananas comosus TaxID=4615 RepID=A0A6P5FKY2_ANACO|nr:jacalin-related lectin 34-like [Ananas comosus]
MAGTAVQQGPWGGANGAVFDMHPQPIILGFTVWADSQYINGIQFQYGQGSSTSVYGTRRGTPTTVTFQPGEFLNGIEGSIDKIVGAYVVCSLTFNTNTSNTYGPYGSVQGSTFAFKSTAAIVGFFGRSAQQLNAIGIYID